MLACNQYMHCWLTKNVIFDPGHVIPRLEGDKLQVMRQFLEAQQMAAQVQHESSKL